MGYNAAIRKAKSVKLKTEDRSAESALWRIYQILLGSLDSTVVLPT
jgi:hypothetical protein